MRQPLSNRKIHLSRKRCEVLVVYEVVQSEISRNAILVPGARSSGPLPFTVDSPAPQSVALVRQDACP